MSLPRKQKIIGRQYFKLVFDEFLHPLDLVKLSLEFNVIAHQQTHFKFGDIFELFECSLHNFIEIFFDFIRFSVDVL